jgi:hypothetical protein
MRKFYKYLLILMFVVGLLHLMCKSGVDEGFSLPGVKLPGVKLPGVTLPNISLPGMSKIRPYMRKARMLKEEGMSQIDKLATRYAARSMTG